MGIPLELSCEEDDKADDDDKSGWNSSMKRYSYAYKAVEEIGDECHPFEVLTTLKNLKQSKFSFEGKYILNDIMCGNMYAR